MGTSSLPEGFGWLRAGAWQVAVREDFREAVESADFSNPESVAESGDRCFKGRGRPSLLTLGCGTRAVLRRYLHGGLLGSFTGGLFTGSPRPLQELTATEAALRHGVRVPEILAALYRPVFPGLHRGYLLTRLIPDARDLSTLLAEGEGGGRWLEEAGVETRRMHEAGVWHADLHVKNVLVSKGGVTLLDFDRATVLPEVSDRARRLNLFRFDRSVVKLSLFGIEVPRQSRLEFFAGYLDGTDDPERLLLMGERSQVWHRLAWRLRIR